MSEMLDTQDEAVADLLGFTTPRQRRQSKADARAVLEQHTALRRIERQDEAAAAAPPNLHALNVADAMHGVSVGWLSTIFSMDPKTVKQKLRDCPPIHRRKAGFIYDLKQAAAYLVPPIFDIEQHMKTLRPSDLPKQLQDTYWSAMLKQQQWEANAGHLWRDEQVLEVLGETFKQIKFAIQLWPDQVERASGLTTEQRLMLTGMGDALQADIHNRLVSMPKNKKTLSTVTEADLEQAPAAEVDDDYTRLI